MANIRVDLDSPITSGQGVIFKAPVNCSDITGLIVYYPQDGEVVSSVFDFADAHGNNVGGLNLFAEGALVKVLLDTELYRAYVQNPDTNEYLEGELAKRLFAIESPQYPGCYFKGVTNEDKTIENEWINPPMSYGVPYRTTERFDGKPVYKQVSAIKLQASMNNPTMHIPITNMDNIVLCSALIKSGAYLVDISEASSSISISKESSHIAVTFDGKPSKTITVYVFLKYTKSQGGIA